MATRTTTRTTSRKKTTTRKKTGTRARARTGTKAKKSELERTQKARNAVIKEIDANLAKIEAGDNGGKSKGNSKATSSPTRGRVARRGKKATTKATSGTNATRAKRGRDGAKGKTTKKATAKRTSPGILDIAADILAKAKEPMACKAIVELAISKHGWTTNGKTPHATLYAAIIREISAKGKDARFTKVERGRFTSSKNVKARK